MTTRSTERLAELCTSSAAEAVPTVLDDLSVTIERASPPEGADVAASAGVWVGRLRRIGTAKLNHWGLSALVDNAQLLISELVTNALVHGTGHQIVFRFIVGTDVVVLEVDDGSAGRPRIREAGLAEESGRGMLLVAAIAASWGVSEDETRTWCTLTTPTVATRRG
ncbi:ATP-binding protein [Streptomyces sp. NPDC020681]|uniref:ATP-binding protein n=1 Tax=Streptomyces sp. NPDC020681 TaxID=3365083 RepID=UPI00378E0894